MPRPSAGANIALQLGKAILLNIFKILGVASFTQPTRWTGVNDVELATLEWVDWFNKTRLHSTIGYVSPFEFEKRYYDNINRLGLAA